MNIPVSYLLLYALLIIKYTDTRTHTHTQLLSCHLMRMFVRFTLLICKHASYLLVYVKLAEAKNRIRQLQ